MPRKFTLSVLFLCLFNPVFSQIVDTVFTRSQTTVFATDVFRCIAIGKDGHVWAGTSQQGLYKYDGEKWEKAPVLDRQTINDIKVDKLGSIWIAQSGFNGGQATTGGVYYFPSGKSFNNPTYYGNTKGLPTNNARSLFIDTTRYVYGTANGIFAPTLPVWVGCMAFLSGGTSITGAVGRGLRVTSPTNTSIKDFQSIKAGVDVSLDAGSCQAIGGDTKEVWVFAQNNFGKNQILVYNYISGQFKHAYDYTTNPQMFAQYFIARAIYFDAKGRRWIGTTSGDVIVQDEKGFHKITLPTSSITSVNNNAITGDHLGNVYIGTTDGLVIYNGGALTDEKSFKRYSVLDNLPSANVSGVAVDKFGAVWLSTSAGIVRLATPFTVYNLIHPINGKEKNADKFKLVSAISGATQVNGKPNDIEVAADGSKTTMIVWSGHDPENKVLKLLDDAASANTNYSPELGYLEKISVPSDHKLIYLYHHPQYVKEGANNLYNAHKYVLEDTKTGNKIIEGELKIYHAPVLLVHGVWSSVQALSDMEFRLWTPFLGEYLDYQLYSWWYPHDRHIEPAKSAEYYRNKIPDGIDSVLTHCRENYLSAGKVNIVGHSRGGLFARYYLQSNFVPYRNDVNSLITINSPHWGSQAANLVLDKRILLSNPIPLLDHVRVEDIAGGIVLAEQDDPNGAVELKVNASVLANQLNHPTYTDRNKVPVHAITGTYSFKQSLEDLIKKEQNQNGERVPSEGRFLFALRTLALQLGGKSIDYIMKSIYNGEENDVVVPYSSQTGGLDQKYITNMGDGYCHSNKEIHVTSIKGTMELLPTQQKVIELLRKNPNDPGSGFSKGGFKAPDKPLEYNFLNFIPGDPNGRYATNRAQRTLDNSFIKIDESLLGQSFTYGTTVSVPVVGSDDIKTILVSYSGASLTDIASDVQQGKSFTFPYPVPKIAVGKVSIIAYGYNENGLAATDTSFINIGLPPTASLDSIRFEKNLGSKLSVPAKDSIGYDVIGYFSDTARIITGLANLTYSFSIGYLASLIAPDYLKGIIPGTLDVLTASFMGQTDNIDVEITDSIPAFTPLATLPVRLASFTGEHKNGQTLLNWTTAGEIDNKGFEIEFSEDGVSFRKIGAVPGKGNSSVYNNYTFGTIHFTQGKNYYRLKQIDIDGKSTYSSVIIISVNKQSSISLFPNPANNQVILSMNQSQQTNQLQLANTLGQIVLAKTLIGNVDKQVIKLDNLKKGLYIVTVTNYLGEVLFTEKLIVK